MVLISAGVEVTINPGGIYAQPNPTTIPLVVLATRANKQSADGSGTALGTLEANKLRQLTSQRELKQNYGLPVFVTSGGVPVQGDETNEYGLLALHAFLGQGNLAYVVRADIDLAQIVPNTVEPTRPPEDGTYWINASTLVGGVFKLISSVWTAVPFHVFLVAPTGADGANGDWGFDYSTISGTLVFKAAGTWYPASDANVTTHGSATNPLWVSPTTPGAAVNGDFWYKTTTAAGGSDIKLSKYRASDATWVPQTVIQQTSAPSPTLNTVWEDLTQLSTSGIRPLRVGTGSVFVPISLFVETVAPLADPLPGTLWYDDTINNFALYRTDGSVWVPITTTINSNPSATQKFISSSPPEFPSVDAIWIDISTEENLDNFPVIKRWTGSVWLDITSTVKITDTVQSATLNTVNSYWLNTGDRTTRNMVKEFDLNYVAHTVDNTGTVVVDTTWFWKPKTGAVFGRRSQRQTVVTALQATFVANDAIRSESIYYQLIGCPGYPELYDEMVALNTDNKEISFIVADTPKFMIPSGIAVGREITAQDWITNINNVAETGELGFSGSGSPYAAIYYPWGLGTNLDGNNVMVPPAHMVLRAIAYSDSVSAPWFPPAGYARGRVDSAGSVGFLTNDGVYQPLVLNRGQRDILYTNKINPIANIPNRGLTIFGQKTLSPTATALDRVNVARLISKMKYDLQRLLEPFLFEINDATTRRSAQIVTERYLAGLKSLRALYDYAARCDEANNTPDRIDANQLWVDVAIKPARAIEFIYIPVTILGTGDQLPS